MQFYPIAIFLCLNARSRRGTEVGTRGNLVGLALKLRNLWELREILDRCTYLRTIDVVFKVQLHSLSGLHGYGGQYFLREVSEADT